jgi:hypothetical protein
MDELHDLLIWALWAVIIGVIIEEMFLFWNGWKFVRLFWNGEIKESFCKAWLHKREVSEGVGFIVLVIGLAGELALGLLIDIRQKAEGLATAGEIQKANTAAAAANTKAAALLAENVELERALAPRIIEQGALVQAVNGLSRVPLLFSPANLEDAKEVARFMQSAFAGISMGGSEVWQTGILPPVDRSRPGISLRYLDRMNGRDSDAKRVAIAICEQLHTQGIAANTSPILVPGTLPNIPAYQNPEWPNGLPPDAVLISVGTKPNHFWENKMLRQRGFRELPRTDFCTSDEAVASFRADSEKRQREREQQNPPPLPPRVSPQAPFNE